MVGKARPGTAQAGRARPGTAQANGKARLNASRGADGKRKSSLATQLDKSFERYEEAWFNFHRYDVDGSGSIDRSEMLSLLRDLKLRVGRGNRTEEQMEEWAERELKKSDVNGDGVLSFDEFLAYYNSFVSRVRSQCDELYDMSSGVVLGKGAFGVVVLGVHVESGARVAVKKLSKAGLTDSLELLHNEIAVWEALKHPHLVKLIDVRRSPSRARASRHFLGEPPKADRRRGRYPPRAPSLPLGRSSTLSNTSS